MFTYKIQTSINGTIKTLDHLNQVELNNLMHNDYLNKRDNLIIVRDDNKMVEYINIKGLFIVSNKINKG